MVQWEALDALSHQLELCKIDPDSSVVVIFDAQASPDRVALIRAAVERTGAEAIEIRPMQTSHRDQRLLRSALEGADIVIATNAGAFPLDQGDHQTLYLCDVAPQEFAPHASLRRRVTALSTRLEAAETLLLTDAHGSELHIRLSGGVVGSDHGLIDSEHTVAHFPAGWVSVTPARASVNGQLVVMPGDANLGAARVVTSPVVLQIVDDHVSAIVGESPDADVLRALFEHPNEPSAYGVAELSLGMNPGTNAPRAFDSRLLDPVIARLFAGVVTVSFGENLVADRPCAQRVTLSLSRRTVHLDGLPIVVGGRLDGNFAPDVYEL